MQEFWTPYFHQQFALVYSDYKGKGKPKQGADGRDDEGHVNHVLRITPAVGGGGVAPAVGGGSFEAHASRIINFAELMWIFGEEFTAADLHAYWYNARRISVRRAHAWSNPHRRAAQQAHHRATGRYGLGRGVAVGETAWKGTTPKGKGTGTGRQQ